MKNARTWALAATIAITAAIVACGGVADEERPTAFQMDHDVMYMINAGADENLNAGADEDLTAEDLESHQEAIRPHMEYWSGVQRLVGQGHLEWVKGVDGYSLQKRGTQY
jgi:hypothetical protein